MTVALERILQASVSRRKGYRHRCCRTFSLDPFRSALLMRLKAVGTFTTSAPSATRFGRCVPMAQRMGTHASVNPKRKQNGGGG